MPFVYHFCAKLDINQLLVSEYVPFFEPCLLLVPIFNIMKCFPVLNWQDSCRYRAFDFLVRTAFRLDDAYLLCIDALLVSNHWFFDSLNILGIKIAGQIWVWLADDVVPGPRSYLTQTQAIKIATLRFFDPLLWQATTLKYSTTG